MTDPDPATPTLLLFAACILRRQPPPVWCPPSSAQSQVYAVRGGRWADCLRWCGAVRWSRWCVQCGDRTGVPSFLCSTCTKMCNAKYNTVPPTASATDAVTNVNKAYGFTKARHSAKSRELSETRESRSIEFDARSRRGAAQY